MSTDGAYQNIPIAPRIISRDLSGRPTRGHPLYAMHDFNRLMSAMSIDGIWQNNLITVFLRLVRMQLASLFGIRTRIPAG